MKLKGGYRTDERFVDIPDGSWVEAKNILLEKGFKSISNEKGNELITTLNGLKVCGIIPTHDSSIIFSTNSTTTSEIGILKNGVYTKIVNDNASLFKFNIDNPIEGVFKYNYKGDIIVAWCDGVNSTSQPPKILNLNDLPFEIDVNYHLVNANDINLAKIFPNVRVPEIVIDNVNPAGGQLKSGVYYFAIAYEIDNNDITNYLTPSIPVAAATLVTDGSPPYLWNDATPGESTSTSIELVINNLDLVFNFFRLVVISKIEGIVIAEEIGRFPTNSDFDVNGNGKFTYTYGGKETTTVVDLATIFVNGATFTKAKAITAFENRLYFGNTEINSAINYQKYANKIKIKYGIVDPALITPYSNLKDFTDYKTFCPEEIYAINIHLVMLDGTVTKGFHIKGRDERTYMPRLGNRVNYTFNSTVGSDTLLDVTGWIGDDYSGGSFTGVTFIINGNTYTGEYAGLTPTTGLITINNPYSEPVSGTVDMYLTVGNETDLVSGITAFTPLDEVNIDADVKIFQIYDTADEVSGTSNGLMGYWENENELYPDTDDFDVWGIISGVNTNLSQLNPIDPNYVATLRNTKVKHHKMPGQVKLLNQVYTQKPFVIGIQPYDIQIPDEIEDLIQGFYFSYVKRDFNNRTIISNDILIQNPVDGDYSNTYDFALLEAKPSISPVYCKHLYNMNSGSTIISIPGIEGSGNHTKIIDAVEYHPDNNSATTPSNASRAENVSFRFTDGFGIAFDFLPSSTSKSIANLCNYLKNIYIAFNTQQDLVSTGKIVYTNGNNNYTLIGSTIYGGDMFINRVSTNVDTYYKDYFAYCSFNVGYREKDLSSWTLYAYNHYEYNEDYSSLLDIKQPSTYNPFTPEINKFPFRINRSNVGAEESISIGWRTFPASSYFEMSKDKGEIWSLAHLNKELLIQMRFSLFSAKVKDRLATDSGETFLGISDVFDREPDEIISTPFGYIGSQSQWASFVCKIGYVVCDRKQGKIFIYAGNGSKPLEISDIGQRNLFMANLDTYDASEPISNDIDNPFNERGLVATYDEKNERIIFTKLFFFGVGKENRCATMSFSVRDSVWICKHDYTPNYMYSTRNELFFVNNASNSTIYRHNTGANGNFKGTIKSSYIDVVFKAPSEASKIFDSVNWKSEIVNSSGVNFKDKTITHIMLYNTTQCSDIIAINTNQGAFFTPNCVNVQETWKFNDFRDVIKDKTLPFLDVDKQIISSNINNNKNWFDKSLFIDKFVIVRFIYDNVVNNDIYISDVGIAVRESNE